MTQFEDTEVTGSELSPPEEQFLTAVVQDGIQFAYAAGRYEARFHGYELKAWSDSLGTRASNISCVLSHQGKPIARRSILVRSVGVHSAP